MSADALFRCDANADIGLGHLMRCLTLADALAARGLHCHFYSQDLPASAREHILARGHQGHALPLSSDPSAEIVAIAQAREELPLARLLILDHYQRDASWEKRSALIATTRLAFEDMPGRHHECEFLLDQNYGRQEHDHRDYVPDDCRILAGTHYSLLRPGFPQLRPRAMERRSQCQRVEQVLLFLSGSEQDELLEAVLDGLQRFETKTPKRLRYRLITGNSARAIQLAKAASETLRLEAVERIDAMHEAMLDADLMIGGNGSTSWERCCLGLPAITLTLADNQEPLARALDGSGAILDLGRKETFEPDRLRDALEALCLDHGRWQAMSRTASNLCDGLGAERVAEALMSKLA